MLSLCCATAYAGPIGGDVVSGLGSITQAGGTTTIRQSSAELSLSWQSFNVGAAETVNFLQPSSSAIAVNRIADVNGSQILGRVNANGQVYLINPNGILFGQGAQVNVGGLVASTLDIGDANLGGPVRSFSGTGTGSGSVINRGSLGASGGGYIALLGNRVVNEGRIDARLGAVALGAGSAVTLTFSDSSLVRMQVDRSVLNSAAENGGLIRADGGRVLMSAGSRDALLASVVNNTGVIEARTVEAHEGEIILLGGMAAGTTQVGGRLDASAPDGGNGGFIETSAAVVKVAPAAMLTTAAPAGRTGTWLIDPYNLTISNAAGSTGGSFAANANDSVINAATLQTALATTNVTVTTGSSGTQAGDITVAAPLTWSAPTTLGLSAAGGIAINAPISITGAGGLSLTASDRPGITSTGLTFASGASVLFGGGGSIAGQSFSLNGNSYTLVYSMAQLDAIDSLNAVDGTVLTGYGAGLAGNYALATNLVATGTTYTRALISTDSSGLYTAGFRGQLDGLGNTITGLTINASNVTDAVGLIGSATDSTISNMGLVGAMVTGRDNVGALVGYSWGATIQTSYTSSTVTGNKNVGGLVGGTRSFTFIQSSYSNGSVTGAMYTGGLVGDLNFTSALRSSYSTSAVSGVDYTGGLAGDVSLSTVRDSYATGAVSGTTNTGGLIGRFNVSASALVTSSFWNTQTSGQASSAGGAGATGLSTAQMRSQANFHPVWDFAGTWLMYDGLSTPLLRSFLVPLEVKANSVSKTYDSLAYAGANGVSYSVVPDSSLLGTVSYTDLSQGAVNAGSYAVTPAGLYSSSQQGYAVTYTAGGLTINPATLTVTADAASRLYGTTNPAFTGSVSGFVGSDTLTNATSGSELFGSTALSSTNVGSYAITGSGLTANHGNYVFTQAAGNATALTINPATLTFTANPAQRIYGAPEPAFSGSVSGFVAGDTLASATSGTGVYSTPAVLNSNVGSYAVNGSGLTANHGNYVFTQATGNASALTIDPATLTYAAQAASRLYGAVDPVFSGHVTGFVAGDTLANATTGSEMFGSIALVNSNVGSYAITGSGLTARHGNYVFVQAAGNASALSIAPATLTYVADAASRLYGAVDPVLSGGVSGFVAGDTLSSATIGNPAYASTAALNSPVGSYAILGSGLSANHGNYLFAQAPGNATALTLNPATLSYVANAASRLYGAADATFSGTVTGFVAGDSLGSATTGSAAYASSTALDSHVGSYAINGSGLSATGGNYVFVQAPGNATALTIDPATLTVTANTVRRLYGAAEPVFFGSVSGFVAGDTLGSATTGSEVYSTAAVLNSPVGSYGVSGSGLTANHGNYVFVQAAGNAVALTIDPATLTYVAAAASRLYGAVDPVFSGSVTGFVAGDTLGAATTGSAAFASNGEPTSNVGRYGITGSGLTANNGNYVFTQAAGNATALTVNPATLSYVADAASRVYGAADPAFSGRVTGFVAGDTQASATTGGQAFATSAVLNSNVGHYAVIGSGLVSNHGNYVFAQAAGNAAALTINPATLTYVANGASRLYGAADPALSGHLTGFVAGDSLASATSGTQTYASTATLNSNVGRYGVTGSGLSANQGNYLFVQADGNATALAITPATLTLVSDLASRTVGAAEPTFSGSVVGFVAGDTQATATTGSLSYATNALLDSGPGQYAINAGGLTATRGNYVFAQAPSNAGALTITPTPPAPSPAPVFAFSVNSVSTPTAKPRSALGVAPIPASPAVVEGGLRLPDDTLGAEE